MFDDGFYDWLQNGFNHIITIGALDHILFILALCLSYPAKEWKKLLLLVTAFTIGHSITLLLTAIGWLNLPVKWVEFAIPVTIAATAAITLFAQPKKNNTRLIYLLALVFGFIHGMAFGAIPIASMYDTRDAIPYILAFNLGVEGGQLLVVAAYLLLSYIFVHLLRIPKYIVQRVVSAGILIYALFLAIKNFPL